MVAVGIEKWSAIAGAGYFRSGADATPPAEGRRNPHAIQGDYSRDRVAHLLDRCRVAKGIYIVGGNGMTGDVRCTGASFTHDARLYDLLYRDKPYAEEVEFISNILNAVGLSGRSLLEIGCGTGRHAMLLAEAGYNVSAFDLSLEMLAQAQRRRQRAEPGIRDRVRFYQDDVRTLRPDGVVDAAISLFHVIGFLTSEAELMAGLENVRRCLTPGGPFVFDFWYAPAILRDGPVPRERTIEDDEWYVCRTSRPEWDAEKDVMKVRFEIVATHKQTSQVRTLEEVHRVRYFHPDTLRTYLARAGFEMVECGKWLTGGTPDSTCSNAYIAARAV